MATPDVFLSPVDVKDSHILTRAVERRARQMVWDRVQPLLVKLCSEHDPPLDAARAFPEPPGMEEYRQNPEKRRERTTEGVSEGTKH